MNPESTTPADRLEALRAGLNARAAGWWRLAGDRLESVAFAPARDLPEAVARGFDEATRSVALERVDLGIVRAIVDGAVAVSRARDLPPETGSGLWLRRFAAARSVAVPIRGRSGTIIGVVSVALADGPLEDHAVADAVRSAAEGWSDPHKS